MLPNISIRFCGFLTFSLKNEDFVLSNAIYSGILRSVWAYGQIHGLNIGGIISNIIEKGGDNG